MKWPIITFLASISLSVGVIYGAHQSRVKRMWSTESSDWWAKYHSYRTLSVSQYIKDCGNSAAVTRATELVELYNRRSRALSELVARLRVMAKAASRREGGREWTSTFRDNRGRIVKKEWSEEGSFFRSSFDDLADVMMSWHKETEKLKEMYTEIDNKAQIAYAECVLNAAKSSDEQKKRSQEELERVILRSQELPAVLSW